MPTQLLQFQAAGVTLERAQYATPKAGWDSGSVVAHIIGSGWKSLLASDNLDIGDLFGGDANADKMYVVGRSGVQNMGGSRTKVTLELAGSVDDMVSGIAKLRRTNIGGALDSVTVEAPVTAYVGSTNSMWVNDGSNWVDTGQGGQPAPGQLSVSSEAGLPNSISVNFPGSGSAGASAGGRIQFKSPRVSFQDQFLTDSTSSTPQYSASMQHMGWGTLSTTPGAASQTLGAGVSFDTTNIPTFSTYSSPPQFNGIQGSFGWVLTGRTIEPLLTNAGPLWFVTDTYTYYQEREFM